ncbi:AAA family ATPase [Luteibacter sp.]|jgi:energy-coupling factor transporter ATP-binding protein EcfA2|uniref:AAA family ATPase n=1 Tax=Luteibacter sp. TaxID=1886636 RepID=UPI002F406D05
MTILDEVRAWSRAQIDWQREAVARLDEAGSLSADDDSDLFAILKSKHGIADPDRREARAVGGEGPARDQAGPPVGLLAIRSPCNVNALAPNGNLTFSTVGLTVIYGSNGSGKSGYARVLKQACFARDKSEKVYPNTNVPTEDAGVPTAELVAAVGDEEHAIEWVNGAVEVPPVNRIAVFDHRCARAFLDNNGDFAYSPAGLDILADLGTACGRLRALIQKESGEHTPDAQPFVDLARRSTVAGKIAAGLPGNVSEAQVLGAAGLKAEQEERLETIIRALAVPDPAAQALALKNQALRIQAVRDSANTAMAAIGPEKTESLKALIGRSNEAKSEAALTAKAFHETPGQLPNTGGDLWRSMFEAARAFAITSEPIKAFPHLHEGQACPLCQQALTPEATERLASFERFVTDQAQRKAEAAKATASAAFVDLRSASADIGLTEAVDGELKQLAEPLAVLCAAFQKSLNERQAAIVRASGSSEWDQVPELSESPVKALDDLIASLKNQQETMEKATDEELKKSLVAERAELEDRRLLGELKEAAIRAIERHAHQKKLVACLADVATAGITRKSTELTNNMATQILADALNEELEILDIADLRVAMKPEGERGRSTFKLVLERPGKHPARDVLSEGEQRAVAIASFLTERRLSGDGSGIIFDDPVCSLDHLRRQRVARRIAAEAKARQVIVFTHDIFFLFALTKAVEKIEVAVTTRTLSQTQDGYGVATDALPFEGMTTSARVGRLRNEQVKCATLRKNGEQLAYQEAVGKLYKTLRDAWEGCVEEVLLNGTVERFRKSVETNRLKQVEVRDGDVAIVVENMAHCSNHAHDTPKRGDVEVPTPDEISADIEKLEEWRKAIVDRKRALAKIEARS